MTLTLRHYDKPKASGRSLLAVVQAAYHLGEILPLREALIEHGYNLIVAVPAPRQDLLSRFRASTRRTNQAHDALSTHGFVVKDNTSDDLKEFAGLIVMNDWGVPRDLVLDAKSKMVPSFGIVEGVQDFNDADIDRDRRPYRTVDIALCKGQDDFDALTGASREIVGSNRLQALLQGPTSSGKRAATVNCNFSYGVLSSQRQPWLQSVHQGCSLAKLDYKVSKHPGDHGWVNPTKLTKTPISKLLEQNEVLISRFSTVMLEALAVGTKVIYHNSHRELVPTFHNSMGAYPITFSNRELAAALQPDGLSSSQRRDSAEEFLRHNFDVNESSSPAQRSAQVISETIASSR